MKQRGQNSSRHSGQDNDSQYASHIETSFQPMDISFHPHRDNLMAAALVDGSLEGKPPLRDSIKQKELRSRLFHTTFLIQYDAFFYNLTLRSSS